MQTDPKLGWTIALAGLLLLGTLNKLALLVVLVPVAALLAFVMLWLCRKPRGVTQGLK